MWNTNQERKCRRHSSGAKTTNRLYAKSNQFQTSAADEDDKPPFIVPLLGFRKQGELQLFSQEHFLGLPWRLDQCDPAEILKRFRLPDTARTGEIRISFRPPSMLKNKCIALGPIAHLTGITAIQALYRSFFPLSTMQGR